MINQKLTDSKLSKFFLKDKYFIKNILKKNALRLNK